MYAVPPHCSELSAIAPAECLQSCLQIRVTGNRFKAAAAPGVASTGADAAALKLKSMPFNGANNIIVRISDTGGHYGEASRRYQDAAQNYAFLINAVKGRRKPKHL